MEGMQDVYWTMKEVMRHFRRSRPQIDRYRKRPDFPKPIGLAENDRGGLLFRTSEIIAFGNSRPPRTLRPPADDSL